MELSAARMFFFALGAIGSPLMSSALITRFGPAALFMLIAAGHGLLVMFALARMHSRRTVRARTPYVYTPRTSFIIGRLMKRSRDRR